MELKKLFLSIMVVGMISSAALALTPMGPPVSTLAEGQYSVGGGYAISTQALEVSGTITAAGPAQLDDFQQNMYYGCIAYGISNEWSVAVVLGVSDAEFGADFGDDFDGDSEFGYGVQVNRTLHDNGTDTKWGTIFQYCTGESEDKIGQLSTYGNQTIVAGTGYRLDLDWYQMQLALGPAVQVNPDLCIYGGPFLHLFEGDLSAKAPVGGRIEYELEQSIELGGYIGALLNLGGSASLSLEFLISDEAWGAGIGAMFPI